MMELNEDFKKLYRLLENTAANVFLTGKAGTGKTTFLKYFREHSHKRMVVAAPTGVAAINAGGVTLHSLFQLPFEPHIPGQPYQERFRFNSQKLDVIRSLDLLVIDEISMVRADLLDAVDSCLRFIRKSQEPFGGLQLLLIGDMQQLPPVLQPREEAILRDYYPSAYFFHSQALNMAGYTCVELKKVYRQSDAAFIEVLNAVRTNTINAQQLQVLNSRYVPGFNPPESEHYVYLTTHNHQARQVNEGKLDALTAQPYTYTAGISGNFPESAYPTDTQVTLKQGAQVMFIKNDPEKRFYNGKIGTITRLGNEAITVTCPDGVTIDVPRMQWDNVQYEVDETTKEIEEKVVGSFEQFPLRLAWAITIHKSQGLTFDKVMLDANLAFAHGQVYVALSRCRTLEGLVLTSPIQAQSIMNDQQIQDFSNRMEQQGASEEQISQMEAAYYRHLLVEQFDFGALNGNLMALDRFISSELSQAYGPLSMYVYKAQQQFGEEVVAVALKFRNQIDELLAGQSAQLQERVSKGCAYFQQKMQAILGGVPERLRVQVSNKAVVKRYRSLCDEFNRLFNVKTVTLKHTEAGFSIEGYLRAKAVASLEDDGEKSAKKKDFRPGNWAQKTQPPKAAKEPKTPTAQVSYNLFRQGRRVEDIAKERGLTESTVYGHLSQYVAASQLEITELVPKKRVEDIRAYIKEHPGWETLTEIRDALQQQCSFNEIKAVVSLPEFKREKEDK